MNRAEMMKYAKDLQEITSDDTKLGQFLKNFISVMDTLPPETFKVGDIVEDNNCTKAVLMDIGAQGVWRVFTDVGCIEIWKEDDFRKLDHTELINDLVEILNS